MKKYANPMNRKILLPTDFSKNAWYAINYAIELYKNDHCDFYLLNVFSATSNILDSFLNLEPGSELYETAKEGSESGLAEVLDMLALRDKRNTKHHFEAISAFNNVVDAIKDVVEEKDIEIIIMGTKGQTASKKSIFGSTAIYVMEKVRNCPVIVVPEKANQSMPKEIVFPTSYKTHFKRKELNCLIEIAKKCDSTIVILHINKDGELDEIQEKHKQMLKEMFVEVKHSFHSLSNYSVESAVNIFVESRNSDMVAFINKKHPFFGSILSQPMVKGLGFHSKVPILVMHDLRN
jgi:nucleotide-binding universal stress UspA family protein